MSYLQILMFDIVVVGGNLSGAAAAIKAADNDARVALIERNKEPIFPAHCGEAILDTSTEWLNLDKIGCEKNEIDQVTINISSKSYYFKFKNHRMIVFDRNCFERELLNEAGKKDVELMLGSRVMDFKPPNKIILDDGSTVEGKIIIDGSGMACRVGKKIGIEAKLKQEDVGICIQSSVKGDFEKNMMKFWFHKPYAPFGYAWLFPKNNKIANIGIGIPGGNNVDIVKLLDRYIVDMTDGKYEIVNTFRDCLPIAPPITQLVKDNVMIVGDAARLVHAPSGAGIGNALFSGCLAGLIAAGYINGKISSLKAYEDSLQKKIKILKRAYKNKTKTLQNENNYLKMYNRAIATLYYVHKIIPGTSEKILSKRLKKDKSLLESYGDKPFFS